MLSEFSVGQIILLLTTVAGFFVTAWRENRNRKWDLEDRRLAREEIANKVIAQQEVIQSTTDKQTEIIVEKLDRSHESAKAAFAAAGNVHARLESLSGMFDSMPLSSPKDNMGHIERTVVDTNERVRSMERSTSAEDPS